MEDIYNKTGGRRVNVNSAFKVKSAEYLIQSQQNYPDTLDTTMAENTHQAIVINRQATAVPSLSEWGMCMFQGQFPRMKDRLKLEELDERKMILNLWLLFHNYQCSKVGINQILDTFMNNTSSDFESFEATMR